MTPLNKFIIHERVRLSAFEQYWREKHAEDPEIYPMFDDEVDWAEALEEFIYD